MKFLGIDYGEKRVGLAIGDSETKIASPFGVVENKNWDFVVQEIKKIFEKDNIEKIIVGIPLTMGSKKGPQAEVTLRFADFLKDKLSVSIETEDERLTSAMVDKLTAESGTRERDAVAAMIILQSFFDKKK